MTLTSKQARASHRRSTNASIDLRHEEQTVSSHPAEASASSALFAEKGARSTPAPRPPLLKSQDDPQTEKPADQHASAFKEAKGGSLGLPTQAGVAASLMSLRPRPGRA